jgi:DNA polymerase III delta prime subunit
MKKDKKIVSLGTAEIHGGGSMVGVAEVSHHIWPEKYRPTNIDDYIGNKHFTDKLKVWLEEGDVPHIFLYGPAGTGKTTAAKIIVNHIDCDFLFINASDENSVDTIRNKIKGFSSSIGFRDLKIVVLDEADFVTPQGQAALRNLMEVFSMTTRFILTANYRDRIIPPVASRCQQFEIVPPGKKEVAVHVAKILANEKVTFDVKDLALLVDAHYPDMRQIINDCQSHSKDGKLNVEAREIAESDYKTHVLQILLSKADGKAKFQSIRKVLAEARVRDYSPMYRFLFDKVDQICPDNISGTIVVIAEGMRDDAMVVDHEISMMDTLIKVLRLQ